MSEQSFDPDVFMQQTVDAPMSTVSIQCPEGEYPAMIDDFDAKAFRTFDRKDNEGTTTVFSPPFIIQDETVKQMLERDKVVVYHKGMFVDIGPDGGLDTGKGKNVDIGRLREAVGQNAAGAWGFAQLRGAGPVMVKVIHQPDKDDPEKKYARVSKVTRLS